MAVIPNEAKPIAYSAPVHGRPDKPHDVWCAACAQHIAGQPGVTALDTVPHGTSCADCDAAIGASCEACDSETRVKYLPNPYTWERELVPFCASCRFEDEGAA